MVMRRWQYSIATMRRRMMTMEMMEKRVIMMTWHVTGCSKSTAHWPDTLWQWWWDLEGSNSPAWWQYIHHHHHHHHQPSSSSSKNNQHLTIPFWLPSTASRDPSTKSRFGPRVGFKMAAFVQHLKSTYKCGGLCVLRQLRCTLKPDPIWQHWKPFPTFSQLSSTHVIWALPTPLKPSWQLSTAFWLPDVLMMINIILLAWCPRQWWLISNPCIFAMMMKTHRAARTAEQPEEPGEAGRPRWGGVRPPCCGLWWSPWCWCEDYEDGHEHDGGKGSCQNVLADFVF